MLDEGLCEDWLDCEVVELTEDVTALLELLREELKDDCEDADVDKVALDCLELDWEDVTADEVVDGKVGLIGVVAELELLNVVVALDETLDDGVELVSELCDVVFVFLLLVLVLLFLDFVEVDSDAEEATLEMVEVDALLLTVDTVELDELCETDDEGESDRKTSQPRDKYHAIAPPERHNDTRSRLISRLHRLLQLPRSSIDMARRPLSHHFHRSEATAIPARATTCRLPA